jgi:hypothetical protein
VVTAGATKDAFDIVIEVNEEENYANFTAKLRRILMNSIEWTPFKQDVVKNDYILQTTDILLNAVYLNARKWLYFPTQS